MSRKQLNLLTSHLELVGTCVHTCCRKWNKLHNPSTEWQNYFKNMWSSYHHLHKWMWKGRSWVWFQSGPGDSVCILHVLSRFMVFSTGQVMWGVSDPLGVSGCISRPWWSCCILQSFSDKAPKPSLSFGFITCNNTSFTHLCETTLRWSLFNPCVGELLRGHFIRYSGSIHHSSAALVLLISQFLGCSCQKGDISAVGVGVILEWLIER